MVGGRCPRVPSHDPRQALRYARAWTERGLMPPSSLEVLEREAAAAPVSPGVAFGTVALYSLAGALLTAALVALLDLTTQADSVRVPVLALFGTVCGLGALALRMGGRQAWAEGLGVAAAVAVGLALMPEGDSHGWTVFLGLAAGVALPFLAGRFSALPLLGIALFTFAGFHLATRFFHGSGFIFDEVSATGSAVWLLLQALSMAGLVGAARLLRLRWWSEAAGACAVAFVAPALLFIDKAIDPRHAGIPEALLAIPELAFLGLGVALRSRALVLGSALVVAGDAIAFAFDVGGKVLGIAALLLMAGALVALGGLLRDRLGADA
ncbi:MAG: hypothetical protein QOI63_993 [Thermoplasmata archaeon]|jgi:hypothetical protein|nr:hypothetical protein [Thermoplasmata archaeon]